MAMRPPAGKFRAPKQNPRRRVAVTENAEGPTPPPTSGESKCP